MATTLNLQYDIAKAKGEIVLQKAEYIQSVLNTLVADVDANINNANVWTGDSAQKFKNAWNNCADNFNTFVEHIKSINQKIDQTQQQVRQFDQNM